MKGPGTGLFVQNQDMKQNLFVHVQEQAGPGFGHSDKPSPHIWFNIKKRTSSCPSYIIFGEEMDENSWVQVE